MVNYIELREKLLKYKREYENELNFLSSEFESSSIYIKGHLKMIDILLDDVDSMVNWVNYENISRGEVDGKAYMVMGVDLTNNSDFIVNNDEKKLKK